MQQEPKAIEWFCQKTGLTPPPWPQVKKQEPLAPTPAPAPRRIFSPYSTTEAPGEADIYTDSKYEG